MRFKLLLVSLFLSLPFWWGVNALSVDLEDVFFEREVARDTRLFIASVNQQVFEAKAEMSKLRQESIEIDARGAISVLVNSNGNEEILYEKDSRRSLPIASISKLMTANVVLENFDLSRVVLVSEEAVNQEEDFGALKAWEKFEARDLLYVSLIESSNDAAYALAEMVGIEAFTSLMNLEAGYLGLNDTYFVNPTGLDCGNLVNYSSAGDLVKLTGYLLEKHSLIWEILGLEEFNLYSADGIYHHKLLTTNELLEESVDWRDEIIGGKTGWTFQAGGCLLLVLENSKSEYLINVILGSRDRFGEMRKLVDWARRTKRW